MCAVKIEYVGTDIRGNAMNLDKVAILVKKLYYVPKD